jgi:hypothetical protein
MSLVDFSDVVADATQEDNVAGNHAEVYVMLAKNFTREFPAAADVVNGEVTGLVASAITGGKTFAKLDLPQNSAMFSSEETGAPGFDNINQMIGFKFAGMKKSVQAEIRKYKNAGAVFIVPGADGLHYIVGNSRQPMFVKFAGASGTLGTDERGFNASATSVGHKYHCLPLAPAVVAALPL